MPSAKGSRNYAILHDAPYKRNCSINVWDWESKDRWSVLPDGLCYAYLSRVYVEDDVTKCRIGYIVADKEGVTKRKVKIVSLRKKAKNVRLKRTRKD